MHARRSSPVPLRRLPVLAVAALAMLLAAGPAGAQYSGGANLTVNPVLVEIDGLFGYLGTGCPSGSTVEITIDGFPDILDTVIAADDSSYSGSGINLPDGVVAGTDLRVEATCGSIVNFALITAVCNGGTMPVDGDCPDGQTVGGQDPNSGTTTTTTPTSSTTTPDQNGGSTPGGGVTGGTNPDLAVTGASFAERAVQLGATLVAIGALVVLIARRRDDEPVPARVR